jgi:hypothetical protein
VDLPAICPERTPDMAPDPTVPVPGLPGAALLPRSAR